MNDTFNPYNQFHASLIPNCLMEYGGLSFAAKCLWARLVQHAGAKGYCWPKRETLAKELGTNLDKIKRTLRELRRNGFLTTKHTGGKGKPNAYFFVEHDIFRRGKSAPLRTTPLEGQICTPYYSKEKVKVLDSKKVPKKSRRTKAPGEIQPTLIINTITTNKIDQTLPTEFIENKPFMLKWESFKAYRKEIKSPIQTSNVASKLLTLSNNSPEVAIDIITQTMDNEWRGLFEVKGDFNATNQKTGNTAARGKYAAVQTVSA